MFAAIFLAPGLAYSQIDHVRVFATSTVTDGDFGGAAAADTTCQTLADAQGLPGTYKAWIAEVGGPVTSPRSEFAIRDTARTLKLVDGTTIADNWDDLIDNGLDAAISLTEGAVPLGLGQFAWTNVEADATPSSTNTIDACGDWTVTTNNGVVASLSATGSAWSDTSNRACNQTAHFICFQQTGFVDVLPCNAAYEGVMTFNDNKKVMQYCNGTNWIDTGPRGGCGNESCGGSPTERVVFVSEGHDGNMGGVTGADTLCQTSAEDAGLNGDYYAWLAGTNPAQAPGTRFERSKVAYTRVDGTEIASNWTDLLDGTLSARINMNATGQTVVNNDVFTNTNPTTGAVITTTAAVNCSNWSNNTGGGAVTGITGDNTQTDTQWSNAGSTNCDATNGIYCFEQASIETGCTNPSGTAGEMDYNYTTGQMQYCNGTDWISMGSYDPEGGSLGSITTTGLIGYFPLNETEGTSAADESPLGNNGSYQNGLSPTTHGETALIAGGLNFENASNHAITAPSTDTYVATDELTFALWVKPSAYSDYMGMVELEDLAQFYFRFNTNELRFKAEAWSIADGEWNFSTGLGTGSWVHLAVTYSYADPLGTKPKFYINGQETAAAGTPFNPDGVYAAPAASLLRIGNVDIAGAARNFTGVLDDVRIYERVLTAGEIEDMYTAGIAGADADCTGLGDAQISDGITGHCYYRVDAPAADWIAASTTCQSDDAYLAIITSERENDLIKEDLGVVASGNNFWLGGSDKAVEGEWRWVNGELDGVQFWSGGAGGSPVNGLYNAWSAPQPDDGGGNQDCLKFNAGQGYIWDDETCSNGATGYICEKSRAGEIGSTCSSPAGVPGEIIYNDTQNLMQYCNGSRWVEMR